MKKILITLLSAAALLTVQKAKAEVSLSYFYDSLEDEGDWFEADDYGYCWQPRGVSADWSPYTDGYWTYTDAGWTWVSYESFGWATYHYGRWADIQGRGWVWVPGYEWGPAWVSWRSNDDYVGWAPLPARAALTVGVSIGSDVDYDYDIGPSYYNFTSCSRFGSPSLRQVIVDRSENITIINQTTNITNISYRDNYVYNGGPDYDRINRRSQRPIERLRLDRITQVDNSRDNRFNRRENGRLTVVAPPVVPVGERQRPRSIKANLGKVQTEQGWANVRDARLAQRTREKIRDENKGRARGPVNRNNESVAQALRSEARQKQVASAPVRPAMARQQKRADQNEKPIANNPNNAPKPSEALTPQQKLRRNEAAQEKAARQQARQNAEQPEKAVTGDRPRNPAKENRENNADAVRQRQAAQNRQENAAAERKAAERQQQAARERQKANANREQAGDERQQQLNRQRAQANQARQQEAAAARQQAIRRDNQQEQIQANQARAQRQQAQQQQQRRQQAQAQGGPSAQRPQQRPQVQQARPQAQPARPQAKEKADPRKKKSAPDDDRR